MSHKLFDLDLLRTFVSVTEEHSFTGAARRLGLTQQSVSAQIARLESGLGRPLLSRSPQGVAVTQNGEALLIYARRMLLTSDEVRRHFSPTQLVGSVRLGIIEGFASTGLPFVLGHLRRLQPQLEIFMETGRTEVLMQRYAERNLDIVIGGQRPGDGNGEPLWQDKLVWVGDAAMWEDRSAPVPLVMLPGPTQVRDIALECLERDGRSWTVFFESENRASLQAAVQAGLGFTVFCKGIMGDMADLLPVVDPGLLPELGHAEFFMRHSREELVGIVATAVRAAVPSLSQIPATIEFPN